MILLDRDVKRNDELDLKIRRISVINECKRENPDKKSQQSNSSTHFLSFYL